MDSLIFSKLLYHPWPHRAPFKAECDWALYFHSQALLSYKTREAQSFFLSTLETSHMGNSSGVLA